jgi:hypothetical protein
MWRLFLSRNIETQRPRPGTTSWFRVQAEAALWEEVGPLPLSQLTVGHDLDAAHAGSCRDGGESFVRVH